MANDLLEYQIEVGELQEKLLDIQTDLDKLREDKSDDKQVNKVLVRANLIMAKLNKANYIFALKHLVEVNSDNYSLADFQEMKIPVKLLTELLEAFTEARNSENLGK